jgi:ABC-type Fe3+-siderophore transport system permease subunit
MSSNKYKKLLTSYYFVFPLVFLFLFLSGCIKQEATFVVNDDGSIDCSLVTAITKSLASTFLGTDSLSVENLETTDYKDAVSELKKAGFEVFPYNTSEFTGFVGKRKFVSIDEFNKHPLIRKLCKSTTPISVTQSLFKKVYKISYTADTEEGVGSKANSDFNFDLKFSQKWIFNGRILGSQTKYKDGVSKNFIFSDPSESSKRIVNFQIEQLRTKNIHLAIFCGSLLLLSIMILIALLWIKDRRHKKLLKESETTSDSETEHCEEERAE